jgi:hypothetical protein
VIENNLCVHRSVVLHVGVEGDLMSEDSELSDMNSHDMALLAALPHDQLLGEVSSSTHRDM